MNFGRLQTTEPRLSTPRHLKPPHMTAASSRLLLKSARPPVPTHFISSALPFAL
jgi:hypothetical protein